MLTVETETGKLYGDLWHRYDDTLFKQSIELFQQRWIKNGEDPDYFRGKRCLDAGCGGGRISIAMGMMGAASVVGLDLGAEGIADARKRAAGIGVDKQVEFREGSVLDIPFADQEFDFAVCSGVLHHTPGIERGLEELRRVVKPGGRIFFLLYGAGGLFWPLHLVMRAYAGVLGKDEVDRCCGAAGLAVNKRRIVLDDLFVPILETYTHDRVEHLLRHAGFSSWRRWQGARLDHESDPQAMLDELVIRVRMWEAGAKSAPTPAAAALETTLADLCRTVVDGARQLIEQRAQGLIDDAQLMQAIVGHGHHRVMVERS